MQDNFKAWQVATSKYGLTIKEEDYFPLEGMPGKDVALNLFRIYGRTIDDFQQVVNLKEASYLKFHQFKLYPGVNSLINQLVQNRKKIGIVTGGEKSRIISTVKKDFLSKFNTLITGDMTKQGKPSPEPYLIGSKSLGIPAEQCIVVENAPLGIKSAKASNSFCIAISSTLNNKFLQEADMIIDSFKKLRKLDVIKSLLKTQKN